MYIVLRQHGRHTTPGPDEDRVDLVGTRPTLREAQQLILDQAREIADGPDIRDHLEFLVVEGVTYSSSQGQVHDSNGRALTLAKLAGN